MFTELSPPTRIIAIFFSAVIMLNASGGEARLPGTMSRIFHMQLSDLRYLYAAPDVIRNCKKRGVCRVECNIVPQYRREVAVNDNTNVRFILNEIGLTNWNGGKQIRLIKQNAVKQSPFPRQLGAPTQPWDLFATETVSAGDIFIVCDQD